MVLVRTVHVVSEIQLAMGHRSLEFAIHNKELHIETTSQKQMAEVPEGENLVLKERPNRPQIHILSMNTKNMKNHWTRNT